MSTTSGAAVRELDRRFNDGFDVRLLWNEHPFAYASNHYDLRSQPLEHCA